VVRVEPAGALAIDLVDQPALRHHHLETKAIPRVGNPISGRVVLLANEDVSLARCRPDRPQDELFRNADADELFFMNSGRGTLHTMFGPLPFRELDYIVIPRCTTYRLDFEPASMPDLLVIEAAGNVTIPSRYLNPDGQLKLGSPYSERDLHGPREISVIDTEQETQVLVRDNRRLTRYTLASHPFDRCSKPSKRRDSSSVRSRPECSTPTPRQSRCRTHIRTCRPTRSCTMFEAGSVVGGASRRHRSRFIPAAFPTARTPVQSPPAAKRPGPTSSPSWSIPSGLSG
jgi:hypothetical protein